LYFVAEHNNFRAKKLQGSTVTCLTFNYQFTVKSEREKIMKIGQHSTDTATEKRFNFTRNSMPFHFAKTVQHCGINRSDKTAKNAEIPSNFQQDSNSAREHNYYHLPGRLAE